MKSRVFQVLGLIPLAMIAMQARAQLDSSSAVLLKPSGKAIAPKDLDSSRYKIRVPESRKEDDISETPGTYIPSPVPKAKANAKTSVNVENVKVESSATSESPFTRPNGPSESPAPPAQITVPPPLPPSPPPPPAEAAEPAKKEVTVQVRELILGGSDEDIDEAKRQIHPEDPRANLMSISVAPAYFYDGSGSNYSFRNYHSDGPGLGLGMNLWLTPFFGVQSKYFTSVSSSVRDGDNMVPVDIQEFEAGIRFRRHFGYTRRSAQISWGIDYHDSKGKISTESTSYLGRKSSGLSLSFEGIVPSSNAFARTFELSIRPFQHHSEMDTASTARSGTKNQTNAISLAIGSQWTLDRKNQVFWKGQYSIERNLFDGPASTVDPKTGDTPTGVSVTNSLLMFYFGFKWGS